MNQRQTIDQNRHIISGIMCSAAFFILIDYLQPVVVNVLFVNQGDIHGSAVLTGQVLHIIFLNFSGLFYDALIGIGNLAFEKAVPFLIRKLIAVQQF